MDVQLEQDVLMMPGAGTKSSGDLQSINVDRPASVMACDYNQDLLDSNVDKNHSSSLQLRKQCVSTLPAKIRNQVLSRRTIVCS